MISESRGEVPSKNLIVSPKPVFGHGVCVYDRRIRFIPGQLEAGRQIDKREGASSALRYISIPRSLRSPDFFAIKTKIVRASALSGRIATTVSMITFASGSCSAQYLQYPRVILGPLPQP